METAIGRVWVGLLCEAQPHWPFPCYPGANGPSGFAGHNPGVDDLKSRVTALAALMDEYKLGQAELSGEGWRVAFRRKLATAAPTPTSDLVDLEESESPVAAAPLKPAGTPVSSPMTGIYYAAPNPSSPAFVKEGDVVNAGHVVGLIEAMKVFNEITAPISGTVSAVVAETGQLVQPGEPLLYIA